MEDADADGWHLERIFRRLVEKHREHIFLGKLMHKKALYKHMSWHHRFSKQEARDVLRAIAARYEGVRYSNRGMLISRDHLDSGRLGRPAPR